MLQAKMHNIDRKIRMGMIGGGGEGFIGAIHRKAALMDGYIEIVAGAFSSDFSRSQQTGYEIGLPSHRVYPTIHSLLEAETNLPDSEKLDFISIVTPNYLHYEQAKLLLESGFHVVCEKPVTLSTTEATNLKQIAQDKDLLLAVAHNYTCYPMVKEARNIVLSGRLGKIRKIMVEYFQGWLSKDIEKNGQKQASWRTDPTQAGMSCCIADIGTHAENLAAYITGLEITELSADISSFVEGRILEDDANILLRFNDGSKGAILVSQVAVGEDNGLKIRIYGENASIEWHQTNPEILRLKCNNLPVQVLKAGNNNNYLSNHALAHCRTPEGHPEGYIESFANLYRNFAFAIKKKLRMEEKDISIFDFPTINEGIKGMKFIEATIVSGKSNAAWVKL